MSVNKPLNVPKLVEKYREELPDVDRDLLRRIIRVENHITNPSELKKLDRYLAKAFKNKAEPQQASRLTNQDLALWEMAQFTLPYEERMELFKRLKEKAYGK